MDWYYPVLTGVLRGQAGLDRMADRADDFLFEDKGVRCVSDRPWVTTAETCECAMAYLTVGNRSRALDLFTAIQDYRRPDGSYYTGIAYPEEVSFPDEERSTYSAAAVILAADALSGASAASALFVDHDALPDLIDVDLTTVDHHSLD